MQLTNAYQSAFESIQLIAGLRPQNNGASLSAGPRTSPSSHLSAEESPQTSQGLKIRTVLHILNSAPMTSKVIVVPEEDVRAGGGVSVWPTEIHANYASVVEDAVKLTEEYTAEFGIKLNTHTIADLPNIGPTHVTALCIPHCRDDRLSLMTRFCELTFLNDDYYDDAGKDKVREYNDNLQDFFGKNMYDEDQKAAMKIKAKGLFASCMVEMMQIDRTLANELMATYSRILEPTSLPGHGECKTFADYLVLRLANSGLEVFQDMACFGMGLKLTEAEKQKLAPIINVGHHSTFLINDYWSWPKEVYKYYENEEKNLPVNAVCIMMQEHGCCEEEGQNRVREEIVIQQRIHLRMIKELEEQGGPLPERYYKYFGAVETTASGSEYWSCYSPRYPRKKDLSQPEIVIVTGELHYKTSAGATYRPSIAEVKKGNLQRRSNDIESAPLSAKSMPNGTHLQHTTLQNGNGEKHVKRSIDSPTNGLINGSGPKERYTPQPVDDGFAQAPTDDVLAPYNYIASLPSKNIRDKFIDALNLWLHVPRPALASIKEIIGMLHHSSLMLDDIEDNSTLRRGKPCTHVLFGSAQTINSANYTFVGAFDELQNLRSPRATAIFIREVKNMHCGQALDLAWKYHTHCPTVDDYMMMIDNKTGAMFRLCVQLMQAESSIPSDHINAGYFVTQLGRYFQVRDDYQNLVSTEYTDQKGFCEDLDEGKISLPLIYTLMQSTAESSVIKGIMQHRTDGEGLPLHVKQYILQAMESAGALDACQSLAREMQNNLINELHRMEETFGQKNSLIELILRRLWV
ncbi:isoprenoid synthase domain-containing protein [Aspergillus multicolor]|uniref:bifunctional terpene synthase/polyprenyl synthetase family protein n=1 Tax=Aspergillus multicolor TaxID=41759 RepID=UPI003CCD760F